MKGLRRNEDAMKTEAGIEKYSAPHIAENTFI